MNAEQRIPYRPLGLLRSLVEQTGLAVTHVYEDLLFVEHNAYLLRMEEEGAQVSLFFNEKAEADKIGKISAELQEHGRSLGLDISCLGRYRLEADEADETITITFLEDKM